jgi:hypothetical protein
MKIKIIKAEQHGRLATYSIDQYGGWELDGSTSGELYNFELWSGYNYLAKRIDEAEVGRIVNIFTKDLSMESFDPDYDGKWHHGATAGPYYFTKENCLFETQIMETIPSDCVHKLRLGGPEKEVDKLYKYIIAEVKEGIIWGSLWAPDVNVKNLYKKTETKENIYEADEGIDLRKFESISRLEEFLKSGEKR